MKNLITIRDISTTKYFIDKYIILNFYISDLVDGKIKVIKIIIEVYLVYNFKAKLLISINILNSKEINISFHNRILIVNREQE